MNLSGRHLTARWCSLSSHGNSGRRLDARRAQQGGRFAAGLTSCVCTLAAETSSGWTDLPVGSSGGIGHVIDLPPAAGTPAPPGHLGTTWQVCHAAPDIIGTASSSMKWAPRTRRVKSWRSSLRPFKGRLGKGLAGSLGTAGGFDRTCGFRWAACPPTRRHDLFASAGRRRFCNGGAGARSRLQVHQQPPANSSRRIDGLRWALCWALPAAPLGSSAARQPPEAALAQVPQALAPGLGQGPALERRQVRRQDCSRTPGSLVDP